MGMVTGLWEACRAKRLIIFDYDGTLAHLAVDWSGARQALSLMAAEFGFQSGFRPLWPEMARFREEMGAHNLSSLFGVLAAFEGLGIAKQQPRMDVLHEVGRLLSLESPPQLAVFSANLHQTVEAGLGKLDLPAIRHVVGCDDVEQWKPAPEGLMTLMSRTGTAPRDTVFIGDSPGDRAAAATAEIDFVPV
ncbi:MAG TPA: HAD hydrolase-like protein [Chloroflexota bacterium]|nr:HAD hydrolase-like protein [Chloroflexota bacterium]